MGWDIVTHIEACVAHSEAMVPVCLCGTSIRVGYGEWGGHNLLKAEGVHECCYSIVSKRKRDQRSRVSLCKAFSYVQGKKRPRLMDTPDCAKKRMVSWDIVQGVCLVLP